MTEQEILNKAFEIHNQNIIDAKIRSAVHDLQEVDCVLNEKETKIQLLEKQWEEAKADRDNVAIAKHLFLTHRDIEIFRKAIKAKQSTIVC